MYPSHYHQCPECGHFWTCDRVSCKPYIKRKDDRCAYGFSTGRSNIDEVRAHKLGVMEGKRLAGRPRKY